MRASPESVSVSHFFDHAQARILGTFIDYQAKRVVPYTALELRIHAPDANGATKTPKDRTMKSKPLPVDVLRALRECDRAPGWNNRNPDVRRFTLPGHFGRDCTLYVVPFRRWAYRRIEQQAAQWQREREMQA